MSSSKLGRTRALAAVSMIAACGVSFAPASAANPGVPGGAAQNCPNYPCKAQRPALKAWHAQDRVDVRFVDGLKIRVREGALVDEGAAARGVDVLGDPQVAAMLAKYAECTWTPLHSVSEAKLDEMRAKAIANLGEPVADLNLSMVLLLKPGMNPDQAIDDLNALGIVEMAEPALAPIAAPLPGNYQANQRYHFATTDGVNCFGVRLLPGGYGQALSRVCDIEYSYNTAHEDLPAITLLGPAWVDPFNDNNHGTAVLGQILGRDNGWGVVGGVPNAGARFVAANTAGGYNVAGAITTAAASLGIGDVIIIEQQTAGPNYTGVPAGTQFGLVPVEWNRNVYNAIVAATGSNILVIQAAGNGSQNLNDGVYATGNGGHFPFNGTINSGAIIVGAGGSPGSGGDRSRLGFSCYGTRVNLQGWGDGVYTTGYGDLFSSEGVNRWYTSSFGGTSSATPIVTSAAVAFSSMHFSMTNSWPTPATIRNALQVGAAPQLAGFNPVSQNIGPRPNLVAAINSVGGISAPSNDSCGTPGVLSGIAGSVIGRVLGAGSGGAVASCGLADANADVWYAYTAPYAGTLLVSTCGTQDFAGCVDCGQDTVLSLHNACGQAAVTCNDDDTLNISGCTQSGLVRDSAVALNMFAGQSVLVRVSHFNTTLKNGFVLNWNFAPANDSCSTAQSVPSAPVTLGGTLAGASRDGVTSCRPNDAGPDAWYRFVPCADGTLVVSTCGTHDSPSQDAGMDTVVSIYDACGGTELACNDDSINSSCVSLDLGAVRDSVIELGVTGGQPVLIRVAPFGSSTPGPFTLNIAMSVANTSCAFGSTPVSTGTIGFNTSCVGNNSLGFSEPACVTFGDGNIYKDLWYRYTPSSLGAVRITTCGTTFDTKVAVYQGGCPIFPGGTLACGDDSIECSLQTVLNVQGAPGVPMYIRVGGFSPTSFGEGLLNIFCAADWNRSGLVTVQDIFDYLSDYFSGSGDFNGVGGVTVQDIFDYLAAYFAGCA